MKTQTEMIYNDTGSGVNATSLGLLLTTLILNWISTLTLSSVASGMAIAAALSTITYNVIKIVKEVYEKKQTRKPTPKK